MRRTERAAQQLKQERAGNEVRPIACPIGRIDVSGGQSSPFSTQPAAVRPNTGSTADHTTSAAGVRRADAPTEAQMAIEEPNLFTLHGRLGLQVTLAVNR
jgi:hypothetical protein